MITPDKGQTRLEWEGKRTQVDKIKLPFQLVETINEPRTATIDSFAPRTDKWYNRLIWGDNKLVMSSLLDEFTGKIDLIYIDPPFATGADFSMPVRIEGDEFVKEPSAIEIKVYRDTWGQGLASYLQMMYDRLVLMRELLSETGSIYVHLDYRVVHYIKLIMDEIFKDNFQNDIIWSYRTGGAGKEKFAKKHDTILFYSKSDKLIFKPLKERIFYEKPFFNPQKDEEGRYYADVILRDVIEGNIQLVNNGKIETINVKPVINVSKDRLDFPTQKPEGLIELFIRASSNESDIVADFFCGSGTTLAVAEKLGRRWIGCDVSKFAIHLTRKRLLEIPGCRPFQLLNLGRYQKQKLMENGNGGRRYIQFMLELYNASPLQGFAYIHGKKGDRLVHLGPIDSFVTLKEIREAAREAINTNARGIDVLGWDFEMGLHDILGDLNKEYGMEIRLRQIPHEVLEIKSEQGLGRLDELKFFDLNYLDVGYEIEGKKVTVFIKKFVIANPGYIPEEIQDRIKNFTAYIDYWAVDFDYKQDVFHNMRQEYRTKKKPELRTSITYQYDEPGHYTILVKVVDIFGNDTNKLLTVRV